MSELSAALRRTLEDRFGYVRLRGEISKCTHHGSGHVYLTLKDDNACIDGVVWRGSVKNLACRPEQGLEVIVTGKITSYPQRSSYQIVIDTMEPAGVGALLAQLERLKAQLKSEGLFDAARKRPIPAIPTVVGVITSPTGAVIRDILHRIRDRWPCRVLVWPCVVQGDQAAVQVAAAVKGFSSLPEDGPIPRPDVLIVARGGGSVEDLWPFNDEALARAVAACPLPVISAVGHETDTTLIDFVSDRRAPTPTAAAEMATPVLTDLKAQLADFDRRMQRCTGRAIELRRTRLTGVSARLSSALQANAAAHERALLRVASRLSPTALRRPIDQQAERLAALDRRASQALRQWLREREQRLSGVARRLPSMDRPVRQALGRLDELGRRSQSALGRLQRREAERLERLSRLFLSLDPDRPLERGFARVHLADGRLVRSAGQLAAGDALSLKFRDGDAAAVVTGGEPRKATSLKKAKAPPPGQGDLF